MSVYNKITIYEFRVSGVLFAIYEFSKDFISFEDMRASEAEYSSFYGDAVLVGGAWKLTEVTREEIEVLYGQHMVAALEKHFNEHGLPDPR